MSAGRRVVVTGLGVVSSLGCTPDDVARALRDGDSGLAFSPEMRDYGLACQVCAPVRGFDSGRLTSRQKRSMSDASQYGVVAGLSALDDAGLSSDDLPRAETAVIIGTGFGGISEVLATDRILRERKNPSRAGAGGLVRLMNSTVSANLASVLGTFGRAYSVSSAFASGPDNIGHAYELIRHGRAAVCFAGSAEECTYRPLAPYYENWGGVPTHFNDRPSEACRPFDTRREGFVLSWGAGILLLEERDFAIRRGAKIYAELLAYGSANDGADMFRPSGGGLRRAVTQVLETASGPINYVNCHGTGTPLGDRVEAGVLRELLADGPLVSSTKGLSGHAMGASGSLEAAYTLLMMERGFVAPTANLESVDPECAGLSHVRTVVDRQIDRALSVSVGLGGANACILFGRDA